MIFLSLGQLEYGDHGIPTCLMGYFYCAWSIIAILDLLVQAHNTIPYVHIGTITAIYINNLFYNDFLPSA